MLVMTFAVHFLTADQAAADQPLGLKDDEAAPHTLTADEIEMWNRLHPTLVALLPPGGHDLAETEFARQLVYEPAGLLVVWNHDDYQVSVPYWTKNSAAPTFDLLARIAQAVHEKTGLVAVDEVTQEPFLDHVAEAAANFEAVSKGFAEAMDQQSLWGWIKAKFSR